MIDLKPYYQVKLTLLRCKTYFLHNPPKTEDEKYAYLLCKHEKTGPRPALYLLNLYPLQFNFFLYHVRRYTTLHRSLQAHDCMI